MKMGGLRVNALAFFTLREKKDSPVKTEPPRREEHFENCSSPGTPSFKNFLIKEVFLLIYFFTILFFSSTCTTVGFQLRASSSVTAA